MCEILLKAKGSVIMEELSNAFLKKCSSCEINVVPQWDGFIFEGMGKIYFCSSGYLWIAGDDKDIQADINKIGGKEHIEEYFELKSDIFDVWSRLEPCDEPWYYIWEKPALQRRLNELYKNHNYYNVEHHRSTGSRQSIRNMSADVKAAVELLQNRIFDYTCNYNEEQFRKNAMKRPSWLPSQVLEDTLADIRQECGR